MSLTDDILAALNQGIAEPATARVLLAHCPNAEDTTAIAQACYALVKQGKLIRQGTAGKFSYRLADAPPPENRGLAYFPRPKVTLRRSKPLNQLGDDAHAKPPKPGVGQNPGSAGESSPSVPDRAVAASVTTPPATPSPKPERRGSGPAPAKATAGDVSVKPRIEINLCSDGTLTIGLPDAATIQLDGDQIIALGDFLHQTQTFWRP